MSEDHKPVTMRLVLERVQEGMVRVQLLDVYPESQLCEDYQLVWECSVVQDSTRHAQKAALKATMQYLNEFVDLSRGGIY